MFIEKIANTQNGIKLSKFAKSLVCGVDEKGKKIYCDSYEIKNINGTISVVIDSSSKHQHSIYIFTDFECVDLSNLSSKDALDDIKEKWINFMEITLKQKALKEYHEALFAHYNMEDYI